MQDPPQTRLTTIYMPKIGIETALHRRRNTWYIVLPRAYGMANGFKRFGTLNAPHSSDTSADPPTGHPNLNPRFWLRDGADWEGGNHLLTIDELMRADPPIFKDSGLKRKTEIKESNRVRLVEETLVEVILKEEELCQRCAWCGCWEHNYKGEKRHCKMSEGSDGRPVYWCGVSSLYLLILSDSPDTFRFALEDQGRGHYTGGKIQHRWMMVYTSTIDFHKLPLHVRRNKCFCLLQWGKRIQNSHQRLMHPFELSSTNTPPYTCPSPTGNGSWYPSYTTVLVSVGFFAMPSCI
jgi:hypothetical protein